MHGKGVYTWPKGTKYEGEFKDGVMHGKGKYTYGADSYYDGEWQDDQKHGEGKMTFPGGDEYEGGWVKGNRQGFGTYKQAKTGITYHCNYRDNHKTGQGLQVQGGKYYEIKASPNDGKILSSIEIPKDDYDGAVKSLQGGKPFPSKLEDKLASLELDADLQFKSYTFQSGATYEGTWKGTKRHGKGVWKHPEGDQYEGQYADNKEHGWGVYTYAKGKKFCGQFNLALMGGFGVYLFTPDGKERYEGFYENDKKHGKGLYTYSSGVLKFQEWDNGTMKKEDSPSRADLESIKDKVFDAIDNLRKWAPGHLDFLEAEWFERMERFKREDEAKASKKDAEERAAREAKERAEAEARAKGDAEAAKKAAEDAARKKAEDEEAKKKRAEEERLRKEKEAREANELAEKHRQMEEARKKREAAAKGAPVNQEDIKPTVFRTFPYAELKLPGSKLTREEVDYTKREMHLEDPEFKTLFGMDKAAFAKLPQWKIDELRRKHGLY
eukprot:NODE_704_length_1847_cov_169.920467_g573_i0.p1 GENE.NODE_704_length_1847_cov_169.920467_g573_i0~~NODE_704_length_1847_cov_169.920467_g573_i0.p1  ORF type:complete len:579 (-),score=251.58 NODE_704_length_1847_cov_169.920467_g573_i0:111-1598(-)